MVKEKANAKLNLYLDVISKRIDNYHDLETVMVSVDFHDYLTFDKLPEKTIEITANKTITENVEDNIVHEVAEYMLENFELNQGIKIHIEKRIPIAAGLAGGSANAAATLRGLNRLFKLKLSDDQLADIGEKFGSDVPFCIYNKLCIARGRGEQLMFLNKKLRCPVLIITPPIEVSTKQVFQSVKIDDVPKKKINGINNAIYNRDYDLTKRELYNALEPFTFKLFPQVKALKEAVTENLDSGVLMSGSGPSIFVMHKDKEVLEILAKKFSENNHVILTKIK